jgi:hypothetical protein
MTRVLGEENRRFNSAQKPTIFRTLRAGYRKFVSIRQGLAETDEVISPEARRKVFQDALAMYITKGTSW